MKNIKEAMKLYAVTDSDCLVNQALAQAVEEALKAGATFLQLREKDMPHADSLAEAKEIAAITKRYNIPFVINDNIDIAIECGADGVHVGQSDIQGRNVREIIGPNKILGISAATVDTAIAAEKAGADYIGVGAVFQTSTKADASEVSYKQLKEICSAVSIPVVAIGGIGTGNILELADSGIDGVAVVSAIFAKEDVAAATKEMLALANKMLGEKNE